MESGDSNASSIKLLYDTICEQAPAVEHEEIKRMLGRELVEENEMLLEEYKALLEIAGEFEAETEEAATKQNEAQKLLVPDRERLLHNIQFFIGNLNRAATPAPGNRRPATGPLPLASTPREQAVMNYVTAELNTRPPSSHGPGSPGKAMAGSLRPSSARSSSGFGRPSSAPSKPPANMKVRALEMEATKDELRQMLRDENQALLQQAEMVRLQLEDTSEYRYQVVENPAPPVQDIKAFEQKLQKMTLQPQESLLDIMDRTPLSPSGPRSPKANFLSSDCLTIVCRELENIMPCLKDNHGCFSRCHPLLMPFPPINSDLSSML